MNQAEKRVFLIQRLLDEDRRYRGREVPADAYEQKLMLRSLMNVRHPKAIDAEFLTVQDEYLRQEIEDAGITRLADLEPVCGDFYLWQGDITRLECGAIVNAANSGMTGCYVPCHACIDNCIHTFAGIQLRLDCAEIMERQGHEEPTGQAKITKAYNLPCDYVLHTVGPIIEGRRRGKPCVGGIPADFIFPAAPYPLRRSAAAAAGSANRRGAPGPWCNKYGFPPPGR